MGAIEIFKLINEIVPLGKLFSGIASLFFVIPINPDFSWELLLFLYTFIGAVLGAILLFTNELILKGLKLNLRIIGQIILNNLEGDS